MLEARLHAHYAAQWLARYGRSYLPTQSDDSHTSMLWNPSAKLFLSPSSDRGTLALDIPTLTIFWLDPKGTMGTGFSLDGKTEAEAEAMLRAMLGDLGMNSKGLKVNLPYQLPDHPIAKGAIYDATGHGEDLQVLSDLFHQGAEILAEVLKQEDGASPVRCWPHHFDIATLIALDNEKDPSIAKTIGIGLSPGDETYPDPYYYITPWPYPDADNLGESQIYTWHTEGFTAAIINALKVNQPTASRGIHEAIAACKNLLK